MADDPAGRARWSVSDRTVEKPLGASSYGGPPPTAAALRRSQGRQDQTTWRMEYQVDRDLLARHFDGPDDCFRVLDVEEGSERDSEER
jgi:hypothetical protein